MRSMTVAELKHFLRDMPDDAEIVTPAFDHSYMPAMPGLDKAVRAASGDMFEYYEEVPLEPYEVVIDVVVFD